MGLFRKLKGTLLNDWCKSCQVQMCVEHKQLCALPTMYVGNYVSHDNADYYKKHLVPVGKKAELPKGMYACGIHVYRCPECGRRVVKLTVFLPVRDEEKLEQVLLFEEGEMDDFIASI